MAGVAVFFWEGQMEADLGIFSLQLGKLSMAQWASLRGRKGGCPEPDNYCNSLVPKKETREGQTILANCSGLWAHLMPCVLNDTSLLRQDLNEPLGFTLIEHHASNRGD
jgi:hypothetical protein